MQRQSTIKYLLQFSKLTAKNVKRNPSSTMNGEIATFKVSLFDEFVKFYKSGNDLALEALEAFNQFLPALDKFFDLYEELTENEMSDRDVLVKWYKSAIVSSGDTIRAISEWYNQAIFDNISINMCSNEIENYTTNNGMCFGKVSIIFNI